MNRIGQALHWATAEFKRGRIDSPRLTAEILLGFVLDLSRLDLTLKSRETIALSRLKKYQGLVRRRLKHIPLQYLTDQADFLDFKVCVDSRVLIPRPETEEVFEYFVSRYQKLSTRPSILDLGTGSGVLAIALARKFPNQTIYACDISKAALRIARANARQLQIKNIRWYHGNFLEAFPAKLFSNPVWMIANPPYIALRQKNKLSREVLKEPELALFAGRDGLAAYHTLQQQILKRLSPGSSLVFEIGFNQKNAVLRIFRKYFMQVETQKDLNGKNRIFFGSCFLNIL